MPQTNRFQAELLATGIPFPIIELLLRLDAIGAIGPELQVENGCVTLASEPKPECIADLLRHGFSRTAANTWLWERPTHKRFVLRGNRAGDTGTLILAEGVRFSDGSAVLNWRFPLDRQHKAIWDSLPMALEVARLGILIPASISSYAVDWEI